MPEIKTIIFWTFQLIQYLIIARILLSWIPININSKLKGFMYNLTEPLLSPVRKLIPATKLGFDLSPILVILCLRILQSILS